MHSPRPLIVRARLPLQERSPQCRKAHAEFVERLPSGEVPHPLQGKEWSSRYFLAEATRSRNTGVR